MKILYVHHVKNFDSQEVYNSDSYASANIKLYGAQELDTWGGVRLLKTLADVDRFEISPNLHSSRFVGHKNQEVSMVKWLRLNHKTTHTAVPRLMSLLRNGFDPSVSFWDIPELMNHFLEVLISSRYDLIWVDTQFYLPLFRNTVKQPIVIRSVNFEPRHVLAEDYSYLRYFKALAKTLTELRASRIGRVVGISPRDLKDYNKLGIKTSLLPLRQLPFILQSNYVPIKDLKSLYFTGSSYDVLHNRRNLMFILNEIAPKLNLLTPEIRIKVSGNRYPIDLRASDNVLQVGFLSDLQSRLKGSLSVLVPYSGGAGMQSKAFESLSIGANIIANPDVIAGYPFLSQRHYTPARNAKEFIEAILYATKNYEELSLKANASKRLAADLFSHVTISAQLKEILESLF